MTTPERPRLTVSAGGRSGRSADQRRRRSPTPRRPGLNTRELDGEARHRAETRSRTQPGSISWLISTTGIRWAGRRRRPSRRHYGVTPDKVRPGSPEDPFDRCPFDVRGHRSQHRDALQGRSETVERRCHGSLGEFVEEADERSPPSVHDDDLPARPRATRARRRRRRAGAPSATRLVRHDEGATPSRMIPIEPARDLSPGDRTPNGT